MSCGIYQITNTVTGKCYVGSSVDIDGRWSIHRSDLRNNRHHSIKLQRSWNIHLQSVWTWTVLQLCDRNELSWLEALWMDKLNSVENGYNCSKITLENGNIRRFHSEKTKDKIKRANLGKECSEEKKSKLRKPKTEEAKSKMRGKIRTVEMKKHLSEIRTGTTASEETKKKISDFGIGRKPSEDTLLKLRRKRGPISEAELQKRFGRNHSEETKNKISESKKGQGSGRTHSEETRKKMSDAAKKRWA